MSTAVNSLAESYPFDSVLRSRFDALAMARIERRFQVVQCNLFQRPRLGPVLRCNGCCVRNPRFEQKRLFVGGDDVPPLGDLDFFTLAQEVFNLLESVP